MKYKNIELTEDDELSCGIEFSNDSQNGEIVGDFGDKIQEAFSDFEYDIYIEPVTPDAIDVRCLAITINEEGISLLKKIYDKLTTLKLDAEVVVEVYLNGKTWFERADGSKYNMDTVSWNEFIKGVSNE